MSAILTFGMASSKKEKHYANSRARRHSDIVISQNKKSKKDKDTDTESVSSSTASSADTIVVPPPPEPKKCPLRFVMTGLFEADNEAEAKKPRGCPLRRVQVSEFHKMLYFCGSCSQAFAGSCSLLRHSHTNSLG